MIKTLLLAVFILSLSCCSTSRSQYVTASYEFKDEPQNERVVLVYKNTLHQRSCLLPEFWPNPSGNMNEASNRVFLMVGNTKYNIEDFATGYCPWCKLNVNPNEEVSAFIKYKSFNLPKEKYTENKQLIFNLEVAFPCKEKTNW